MSFLIGMIVTMAVVTTKGTTIIFHTIQDMEHASNAPTTVLDMEDTENIATTTVWKDTVHTKVERENKIDTNVVTVQS